MTAIAVLIVSYSSPFFRFKIVKRKLQAEMRGGGLAKAKANKATAGVTGCSFNNDNENNNAPLFSIQHWWRNRRKMLEQRVTSPQSPLHWKGKPAIISNDVAIRTRFPFAPLPS